MSENRYAILIDADNTSYKYIKSVIDEVAKEGIITYRRIYGDWTSQQMQIYKQTLLDYSITPMQQYSYTTGKNSTDSALIIDAMDILYTGNVEGFCLVSSDSDFTKLAIRLKEAGMKVMGIGRKQTPKSFVQACTVFKFIDVLSGDSDSKGEDGEVGHQLQDNSPKGEKEKKKPKNNEEDSLTPIQEIENTINDVIDENSNEEGWALSSLIGSALQKRHPDFDSRNFGYKKITDFLKSRNYEIKNYKDPNNKQNPNGHVVYIRIKGNKNGQ